MIAPTRPILFLFLAAALAIPICAHAQAPANDNFASPTALFGDPRLAVITHSGTTVDATKEAAEPNHALTAGGASVWFTWTSPIDAAVVFDLAGSSFDSVIGVYTGDAIDSLSFVIFNDDSDQGNGVSIPSKAIFNATAGTTYRIAVDGYPDAQGVVPSGSLELAISLATPPVNDSFESATDLGGAIPLLRSGDTLDDSTIQNGERFHGGSLGFGSVWYQWTAADRGAIEARVYSADNRPLSMSVYTGNTLGNLQTIDDTTEGEPLIFATEPGQVFHIAVLGEYVGGAQARGGIAISLSESIQRPLAGFGFGQDWSWLHPLDGIDPATADPDFATTWQLPAAAAYDGPGFQTASPAPLGYGTIAWADLGTNIGIPATGSRYSAYFVREFTLDSPISAIAEVLADDGAVIYIDGVELGRVNVTGPDDYLTLADGSFFTEARTFEVGLGSIEAGTHTIAVALHNVGVTSSDLGFDLRLHEASPPVGRRELDRNSICVDFEGASIGDSVYHRPDGEQGSAWVSNAGKVVAEGDGQAFEINALDGVRLQTETVDVSSATNVTASFDLRVLDTSSGFENTDFLHVYVEGSRDGVSFRPVADIFAFLVGGDPDPFELYRSPSDFTNFTTAPGDIPEGLVAVRIVVEATANSGSEHIYIDNLCLKGGATAVRITEFSASRSGGMNLRYQSEPGHLYNLQSSPDLGRAAAWTTIESFIATDPLSSFVRPGAINARRMYYRVVDFGLD